MDGANAYALLGLDSSASPEVVTRAFRAAAKRTHPDHGGDRRDFEQIFEAYAVLRALPKKRTNPFLRFDATPVAQFDVYDAPRRPMRRRSFEEELAAALAA